MVADLIDLARLREGRLLLEPAVIDLRDAFRAPRRPSANAIGGAGSSSSWATNPSASSPTTTAPCTPSGACSSTSPGSPKGRPRSHVHLERRDHRRVAAHLQRTPDIELGPPSRPRPNHDRRLPAHRHSISAFAWPTRSSTASVQPPHAESPRRQHTVEGAFPMTHPPTGERAPVSAVSADPRRILTLSGCTTAPSEVKG